MSVWLPFQYAPAKHSYALFWLFAEPNSTDSISSDTQIALLCWSCPKVIVNLMISHVFGFVQFSFIFCLASQEFVSCTDHSIVCQLPLIRLYNLICCHFCLTFVCRNMSNTNLSEIAYEMFHFEKVKGMALRRHSGLHTLNNLTTL